MSLPLGGWLTRWAAKRGLRSRPRGAPLEFVTAGTSETGWTAVYVLFRSKHTPGMNVSSQSKIYKKTQRENRKNIERLAQTAATQRLLSLSREGKGCLFFPFLSFIQSIQSPKPTTMERGVVYSSLVSPRTGKQAGQEESGMCCVWHSCAYWACGVWQRT